MLSEPCNSNTAADSLLEAVNAWQRNTGEKEREVKLFYAAKDRCGRSRILGQGGSKLIGSSPTAFANALCWHIMQQLWLKAALA